MVRHLIVAVSLLRILRVWIYSMDICEDFVRCLARLAYLHVGRYDGLSSMVFSFIYRTGAPRFVELDPEVGYHVKNGGRPISKGCRSIVWVSRS